MKKLLAVLLAALLLAAPAFAQTASLAGEWTMTKTVASGVVMSPEAYGLSMTIVLNPDGTAFARQTINGAPMEENGTWTQAGNTVTITSQLTGEVSTFTLQSDGTLLAMVDGVAMYFYADRSRAAGDERARRRAAAGRPAALHGRHGSRHGQF